MKWIMSAALVAFLLVGPGFAAEQQPQLSVTGEGVVEAAPDMATVSLGVYSEARTADAALAENNRNMAAVLEGLRAAGIAERDLQTSGLSLNPRWDNRSNSNNRPQIVGFMASNQLSVRVRDLGSLGALLDQLVGTGANRLNGVTFGLQDPRPLQDEARAAAVKDAMAKAALYAEAAGVKLGPIQSLSEAGGASPQPMAMARMEMAMASDAVPIAAGELSLRAQVSMVFAIGD